MNWHGIAAIYRFEMARWLRTLWQSLITPVITTSLYFVVFGSALGGRMSEHGWRRVSAPSSSRADLTVGIHAIDLQLELRHFLSEIYGHYLRTARQHRSRAFEAVLAYVGAAVTKSVVLALVTLATATLFVPVRLDHPLLMVALPARHFARAFACSASRSASGRRISSSCRSSRC